MRRYEIHLERDVPDLRELDLGHARAFEATRLNQLSSLRTAVEHDAAIDGDQHPHQSTAGDGAEHRESGHPELAVASLTGDGHGPEDQQGADGRDTHASHDPRALPKDQAIGCVLDDLHGVDRALMGTTARQSRWVRDELDGQRGTSAPVPVDSEGLHVLPLLRGQRIARPADMQCLAPFEPREAGPREASATRFSSSSSQSRVA